MEKREIFFIKKMNQKEVYIDSVNNASDPPGAGQMENNNGNRGCTDFSTIFPGDWPEKRPCSIFGLFMFLIDKEEYRWYS
ncbi:hypothetical protein [Eubacterium pyruvativorans]|uniref:hypothetical protein n=1 Tax=Eubacterium pyruvativorans TaxID=155865 RepID=UPI0023EFF4B9|nr:hypothetical protein [Eubacterium pyruvativorans]